MKRIDSRERANWESKVEKLGLIFHHHKLSGKPYWDESKYYELTAKEVDVLEQATNELQRICLIAGQHIIDKRRYAELGIPANVWPAIERTWQEEPPAIYGRMDLAYDGSGPPKLLEYNADTPTSLLEAAVIQWHWLQDTHQSNDQWNSIHERLVAKWKELRNYLTEPLYLAHMDDPPGEDTMTANYLQDTAQQGGLKTEMMLILDIGWDGRSFVDMNGQQMKSIFKLYPWEWMVHEDFGAHALVGTEQWLEPVWKMLWSNKGILPILWELFPGHPNLLEARFDGPGQMSEWIKKPKMGREGANVILHGKDVNVETTGDYGEEGFVYQARGPVWKQDNNFAVLGSWIIDGESAGLGVRESDGPVTDTASRFVPHLIA
jgi:glutathionylspermidine synthase